MNDRVLKITRISMLLSLAVIIHSAEAFIPVNVLWFRFGFANIITVAVLFLYGFRTAFLITVIRIFLGSILIGALGSPAFILSLSGGLAAIAAMGFCKRLCGNFFSEIGISLIGAVIHNLAQLLTAYAILIKNEGIFLLLPVMIVAACVTGFLNGLAARFLLAKLETKRPIH